MPSRFRGDTLNQSLQLADQLPSSLPSFPIPASSAPGQGAASPLRRGTDAIRSTLQSLQATTPLAPAPLVAPQAPAPVPEPQMPLKDIIEMLKFDPRSLIAEPPAPVAAPPAAVPVVAPGPPISEEQQLIARLNQVRGQRPRGLNRGAARVASAGRRGVPRSIAQASARPRPVNARAVGQSVARPAARSQGVNRSRLEALRQRRASRRR